MQVSTSHSLVVFYLSLFKNMSVSEKAEWCLGHVKCSGDPLPRPVLHLPVSWPPAETCHTTSPVLQKQSSACLLYW